MQAKSYHTVKKGTMHNPFEAIDRRLDNLEALLIEIAEHLRGSTRECLQLEPGQDGN
jgi:hypothetical protein